MWRPCRNTNSSILRVADVGYGLSTQYCSNGSVLQIDAGGAEASLVRHTLSDLRRANELIITHYHADHYRGLQLLKKSRLPFLHVSNVYLPPIPCEKAEFLAAFSVVQALGGTSGSMEIDLFHLISELCASSICTVRKVFQGEKIQFADKKLHVVWPPKQYDAANFSKRVIAVLDEYHEAIDGVDILREYTKKLTVQIEGSAYFGKGASKKNDRNTTKEEEEKKDELVKLFDALKRKKQEGVFAEEMSRLNKRMRAIANEVSLAFHDSDRLLFFSDQEDGNLPQIVEYLMGCGLYRFDTILAAHHGTHWHDDIRKLHARRTITSNGDHLSMTYDKNWDSISWESKQTRWHGNIEVCFPMCSPC